ncbi:MAG: rhodanese-like domain-containing protein [Bdellovibrionaceae bacterium]|nr:rhodanese-like domain-containing protein [Bdellovibrionales bacterium]MCB9253752.1 rhodanese-like domain-containing protein [Pseudobdellovibrionaceae bacterium]
MSKLSSHQANEYITGREGEICFVDVRSQDEFKSGYIPQSKCIPLPEISKRLDEFPKDRPILLSCQSGMRSAKARQLLESHGFKDIYEVDGGFSAWKRAGLPTSRSKKSGLSIQRQVFLTAGTLILSGTLLSHFVNPSWWLLPFFVGVGLTFNGLTGFCGMAKLLEAMPWNKAH